MVCAMPTHLRQSLAATREAAEALPVQLSAARDALTSGVQRITTTTAILTAGVLLALAVAVIALIRAH